MTFVYLSVDRLHRLAICLEAFDIDNHRHRHQPVDRFDSEYRPLVVAESNSDLQYSILVQCHQVAERLIDYLQGFHAFVSPLDIETIDLAANAPFPVEIHLEIQMEFLRHHLDTVD